MLTSFRRCFTCFLAYTQSIRKSSSSINHSSVFVVNRAWNRSFPLHFPTGFHTAHPSSIADEYTSSRLPVVTIPLSLRACFTSVSLTGIVSLIDLQRS